MRFFEEMNDTRNSIIKTRGARDLGIDYINRIRYDDEKKRIPRVKKLSPVQLDRIFENI